RILRGPGGAFGGEQGGGGGACIALLVGGLVHERRGLRVVLDEFDRVEVERRRRLLDYRAVLIRQLVRSFVEVFGDIVREQVFQSRGVFDVGGGDLIGLVDGGPRFFDADALGHIAPIQRAGILSPSVFDEVFGLGFCLWHEIGRLSRGRCRAEDECQGGQCGGAESTGRGEAAPGRTGASARGRVFGCAH